MMLLNIRGGFMSTAAKSGAPIYRSMKIWDYIMRNGNRGTRRSSIECPFWGILRGAGMVGGVKRHFPVC